LKKKIAIISGQHLVSNPRVWKEANLLSSIGYSVSIFTLWYDRNLLRKDAELISKSIDYHAGFSLIITWRNILVVIFSKLTQKFANLNFILFKRSSIYQIVYSPKIQLRKINEQKFDLFICHQEPGLLLGVQLLKLGARVAFDFEDWYSEDYFNSYRPVSLLKQAEAFALKFGKYVSCPSRSMAIALESKYETIIDVNVLYNSFPVKNYLHERVQKIPNSFVWFSQTIGRNRGIESFLSALQKINIPLNIHFIGNCTPEFKNELFDLVQGTPHKIEIHHLLRHDELMMFLQKFQIGLALDTDISLSRKYTITNKILTYLQLNLHVIASITDGHLELKQDFADQITYIDFEDRRNIDNILENILNHQNHPFLKMFPDRYSWESQEKNLSSLVKKSIVN
jgi:hypothetical protein